MPAEPPPRASKTPGTENFPVASRLLAPAVRPAVLAFYQVVRGADDVADDPALSPDEKLARLDRVEQALADGSTPMAAALLAADRRHCAGVAEARLMLRAFRQDAVQARYATWDDLLASCALSADPVGRFLLALHGEPDAARGPSDALCTALQLLNHLQDLGRDRAEMDRVYLPLPWLERTGGEEAFFAPMNGARRRPVLDAALDRVDALIGVAESLPARLRNRRLRLQALATLACARRLSAKLRLRDPIEERVALGPREVAAALAGALLRPRARPDQAVTEAIVRRSGSSFRLGMRSQGPEARRAIHAVYAFCRAVDDIADGAAPPEERARFLEGWRGALARLGEADDPICRELAWAQGRFGLPLEELHRLLDGMATDAAPQVRLPDDAALDLYARRVAGSVGLLSVHIFGLPEARDFALGLGRTLQLVNILRDVDDDAQLDRVYIPLDRLAALGVEDRPARLLVADPRLARVCEDLASEAEQGFARADRELGHLDRRRLKPAVLMMEGYRRILVRLKDRGFRERGPRMRLTSLDRVQLLRAAVGNAWGNA